jgi:hypothetical protein
VNGATGSPAAVDHLVAGEITMIGQRSGNVIPFLGAAA